MHNILFEKIKKAEIITIFRHQFPDMDALGSQWGLRTWIQDTFPSKQVYCLGENNHLCNQLQVSMDIVEDQIVQNSLAIVLDTSNKERVDDDRYKMAKESIRFDHHVFVEKICDEEWIEPQASATCEMLALFLESHDQSLSKQAAQFLFNGLNADSIHFSVSSVRAESFLAAAYLAKFGIDVVQSQIDNYSCSLADFEYEKVVRNHIQKRNQCFYSILEKEDYEACGLSFSSAKEKVYCLSGVRGIQIWALFTRMEDGIHYSASLRSLTIPIRDIASEFGGGGHECAAGIKNLTREQVDQILNLLAIRSQD